MAARQNSVGVEIGAPESRGQQYFAFAALVARVAGEAPRNGVNGVGVLWADAAQLRAVVVRELILAGVTGAELHCQVVDVVVLKSDQSAICVAQRHENVVAVQLELHRAPAAKSVAAVERHVGEAERTVLLRGKHARQGEAVVVYPLFFYLGKG